MVPIGPRPQIVAALQDRLVRLAAAPEVLAPLSAAARDEVLENFTWDAKARKILSVYTRLRPSGDRAETASV